MERPDPQSLSPRGGGSQKVCGSRSEGAALRLDEAEELDGVMEGDFAAGFDVAAEAAVEAGEGFGEAGVGVELLDVAAGVAGSDAGDDGFADAEADADEAVEAEAAGDEVAAGLIRLDADGLGDFGFEESEFLVVPTGVAPLAGAEGVTVADDAEAGDEYDRALLFHGGAGARRRVDTDERGVPCALGGLGDGGGAGGGFAGGHGWLRDPSGCLCAGCS